MSRSVRQYAAHLEAEGRPPVVHRLPDGNESWRRRARRSPAERASDPKTSSEQHETPKAAQRVVGAALRSVSKARPGDDRLAVTLTVAELRELVRDVALEVLAEGKDAPPALLDRNGLARAIGVGLSSVDRFRREGCPVVWIGEAPRFELCDVLTWLRGRERP